MLTLKAMFKIWDHRYGTMSTDTTPAVLTPDDIHVAADCLRDAGLDEMADRMRRAAKLVDEGARQIAEWQAAGDWRGDVDWEAVASAVGTARWLARDCNGEWWHYSSRPKFDGRMWLPPKVSYDYDEASTPMPDIEPADSLVQRPWLPSDVLRT